MAFNKVQWDGVYSGFNGVEFTQDCPEKGNIVKQFEFVVIFLATLFLHVFTVVFRESPIFFCVVFHVSEFGDLGTPTTTFHRSLCSDLGTTSIDSTLDHMIWMEVSKNFLRHTSDPTWQTASQTAWACSILGAASQPQ